MRGGFDLMNSHPAFPIVQVNTGSKGLDLNREDAKAAKKRRKGRGILTLRSSRLGGSILSSPSWLCESVSTRLKANGMMRAGSKG